MNKLSLNLIVRTSNKIFESYYIDNDIVSKEDYNCVIDELSNVDLDNIKKSELCSILTDLNIFFDFLYSEYKKNLREVTNAIFEQKPDLYKEKKALDKKLEAEPEYANIKNKLDNLYYIRNFITSKISILSYNYKINEADNEDDEI